MFDMTEKLVEKIIHFLPLTEEHHQMAAAVRCRADHDYSTAIAWPVSQVFYSSI